MAEPLGEKLETILVVDDSDAVLGLVVDVLTTANFNVLQAESGASAIELATNYVGRIDLLLSDLFLSDVRMPVMSGPILGDTLKQFRPDMHVMFMSGYPGGNLVVLNYGWSLIEKPFVPTKLLQMVNDVLHTPNKAQSTHQFDTRKDADPNKKIEA